jgi:hypothetical protein
MAPCVVIGEQAGAFLNVRSEDEVFQSVLEETME